MSATTTDVDAHAELVLLPAGAIHARRRPAAILFVYAYELMWSLLAAAPFHTWAKRVWSAHPEGDAPVFRPGGLDLMGWLLGNEVALGTAIRTTILLLAAGAIIAQLPLGLLLGALTTGRGGRAPKTGDAFSIGWGALPSMFVVLVFTSLAQLGVLLAGGGIAFAINNAMKATDAAGGRLSFLVFGAFVILALFVGVVGDVWRAASVRMLAGVDPPKKTRVVAWRALKLAFRSKGLGGAIVGWSWRAVVGVLVVVLGAFVSGLALPIFVTFLVHQIIVAFRVGLRASWLAQALRIVTRRGA